MFVFLLLRIVFMRLGPCRNREHHFVGVLLLVLFDLLLCQGGEAIFRRSDYEKSAADNVIRHSVVIGQGTVHRKTQQLSFVVADNGDGIIEGVDGLNMTAYELLHGFEAPVDLLHSGRSHRLHHEDLECFFADKIPSFIK